MNDQNDNNNLIYKENPQQQQNYDEKAAKKAKQIKAMYNPFVVAAMIVILWPIGLYYMWKGEVYYKAVRIIVSVLVAIIVALKIIGTLAA